jgi:malate synthase
MKKTKHENRKRMLGSIRLSKAEKLALGLKSAWIKSDATFEIKKQAFSYKKPIGKSYRI